MNELQTILTAGPVIPVLVIERVSDAVPLARALIKGGVRVLEVTLRSAAALAAITSIAREVPDAIVGAGTVLNTEQLKRAVDAGARFVVSPGLTEPIAKVATSSRVPLLAGVATASDILRGMDLGLSEFKFFPAETSGGVAAIKAFEGPFQNVRFCPTGGITLQNARDYLSCANVLCVGGSWLAPKEAMAAGDWARIEALAREAVGLRK